MAGRRHSKRDQHHLDQAMYHITQVGGALPTEAKAASLSDQIDAVWQALMAMIMLPLDTYPCVEDIYDTYIVVGYGGNTYRADYTTAIDGSVTLTPQDAWIPVEAVWQPIGSSAAKAGLLIADAAHATPYASMKALGNRQIEVKVAFYGHKRGKDDHGEYFSPRTDFDAANFPNPPLLYYHGFNEQNKKMGRPIVTGTFVSRRAGADGHYLTYQLKAGKYADLQWDAAQKGQCAVSPGTIAYLIRAEADGELLYWPLAEISAWDYATNRKQANLHSTATPALKALYLEEGITFPDAIDTPVPARPETPGDGVSVGDTQEPRIDDTIAGQIVATEVAAVLLARRKGTRS